MELTSLFEYIVGHSKNSSCIILATSLHFYIYNSHGVKGNLFVRPDLNNLLIRCYENVPYFSAIFQRYNNAFRAITVFGHRGNFIV